MRPPLIRQGSGPDGVYQLLDDQRTQHHALIRMVDTIPEITSHTLTRATAGGDYWKLRGIPATGGPIPGEGDAASLMQQRPLDW